MIGKTCNMMDKHFNMMDEFCNRMGEYHNTMDKDCNMIDEAHNMRDNCTEKPQRRRQCGGHGRHQF